MLDEIIYKSLQQAEIVRPLTFHVINCRFGVIIQHTFQLYLLHKPAMQ
jgi:hypothetical protein